MSPWSAQYGLAGATAGTVSRAATAFERRAVAEVVTAVPRGQGVGGLVVGKKPPRIITSTLWTGGASTKGTEFRCGTASPLRPWPMLRPREDDLRARIREALGPERFEQAVAAGAELSQPEAIAVARELDSRDLRR